MKFTLLFRRLMSACVIMLCIFGAKQAQASHYAAADIDVQYVGSGPTDLRYKVTMTIYYACEPNVSAPTGFSGGPSAQMPLSWVSANDGGPETTWWIGSSETPEQVIDQLCPGGPPNSCNEPDQTQKQFRYPGFKARVHDTIVTLTSRQTDWRFWTSGCCRNSGILNITTLNDQYVEAGLDNLIRYDNNTPVFMVNPLPYLCQNQPNIYLNGPVDANSDSLVTVSKLSQSNATTFDIFDVGYSAANPINSTVGNPYTVNPTTGTATFTPTLDGFFVLAFRCDKYDRATGKSIGYIMRDVQVTVLQCSSAPPSIDTTPITLVNGEFTNSGGNKLLTVCTGSPATFKITSKSNQGTANVYMEANIQNLPGASFNITNNGSASVEGDFAWYPHYGNVGDHVLIVTTKDSTCDGTQPIVLKNFTVFAIKVIPSIDAGPDVPVCPIGGEPRELYVRGSDNIRVKWTALDGGAPVGLSDPNSGRPLAKPTKTTTYVVSTTDIPNFCKNRDEITVYMDTTNKINVLPENPIVLCKPDYLQLHAEITGRPRVTYRACGTANPEQSVPDTFKIAGNLPGDFDSVGPLTPTFANEVASMKQQYLLKKNELHESGLSYGTLKSLGFEVINPAAPLYEYSNFRISLKCTDQNSLNRNSGFVSGMTTVYTAPAATVLDTGWIDFTFDQPYSWDTSQNLIVEICYSGNATLEPAGNNPVIRYVPTDYASILYLADLTNSVCGVLSNQSIIANYARPQFRFGNSETPYKDFEYRWYPGVFLSDSTLADPLAYVPKSIKYKVETEGRSGCKVYDSADVYIPVHDYTISNDTVICFGESAPTFVKGGFDYNWFEYKNGQYISANKTASCLKCNDPILKPLETTIYKAVVYDSVWCIDTLTRVITVLPLPDIRIITRDTIIKYGQTVQLLASGSRKYSWTPAGSLSNATISNPVARPTERTDYIAGGIGSNGCRAFDTVTVDVDFKDNLFIPSGFSPNGDGKNDMFRVANLTFQRIQEFRVFNRWGQEVYSNNGNTGWDGMWKGEPQDLGTYQYQIKVGLPDGTVEVFKGDVILVR